MSQQVTLPQVSQLVLTVEVIPFSRNFLLLFVHVLPPAVHWLRSGGRGVFSGWVLESELPTSVLEFISFHSVEQMLEKPSSSFPA